MTRKPPALTRVAPSVPAVSMTRVSPELTTMRQPFERIAHEMVRMLLDVIEGRPAARMTLPTELVRRESG